MRYLISIFIAAALFLPVVLADNCTTAEKSEKATCPYMKAVAEGKSDDYSGKVCPVTGKKAGEAKAHCGAKCPMTCCGAAKTAAVTADSELKPQTTCPVMGGKINKELYVDHDGKRIYLCCGGCVGKVKADPEKYIKQLEAQGIQLEKVESAEI